MNERRKLESSSSSFNTDDEPAERKILREQTIKRATEDEFKKGFEGFHYHHCNYCGEDYECDVTDFCCYSRTEPCIRCR